MPETYQLEYGSKHPTDLILFFVSSQFKEVEQLSLCTEEEEEHCILRRQQHQCIMYNTSRMTHSFHQRHMYNQEIPVECRTLEGEPERSACTRTCKEQLHSHDCHQNVTGQCT